MEPDGGLQDDTVGPFALTWDDAGHYSVIERSDIPGERTWPTRDEAQAQADLRNTQRQCAIDAEGVAAAVLELGSCLAALRRRRTAAADAAAAALGRAVAEAEAALAILEEGAGPATADRIDYEDDPGDLPE